MNPKKWLKKLIGKNDQAELRQLKPRSPRVTINPLHEISLSTQEGEVFQVANISDTGVGLLTGSKTEHLTQGLEIKGVLRLQKETFDVTIRVIFVSPQVIGCVIAKAPEHFAAVVNNYFRTEVAAGKLLKMKDDLLKKPEQGLASYFSGSNNCELYFIEKDDELFFFELTFFGNHIEGRLGKPLIFGIIDEDQDSKKPHYKGSSLVRSTNKLSPETLKNIARFIEAIEGLSPKIKKSITSLILHQ